MSVQFVDIYTINSEAPAISLIKEESKLRPLNLVLEIKTNQIVVKTGLDGDIKKTYNKNGDNFPLDEIRSFIIALKKEHVDESTVTFKPEENVEYQEIVKIIDVVRHLSDKEGALVARNKKGEEVTTKSLFDQVVFETII